MTVSSEVTVAGPYDGNGVTTIFPFEFRIVDEKHLRVVLRDPFGVSTDLSLDDGDYSVSGVGNDDGDVTVAVAPSVGYKLTILRNPPFTQETDLTNQGPYSAEVVENRFDLLVMQIQAVNEKASRAYTVEPGQTPPSLDLVVAAEQNAAAAAASASDAADAALLAARFANEPEDSQVQPGLFSAYHWMRKALAIYNAVIAGIQSVVHTAPEKTTLQDADEFLVLDSASSFGIKKFVGTTLLRYIAVALGLDLFTGFIPAYSTTTAFTVGLGMGVFGGRRHSTVVDTACSLSSIFGSGSGCLDTGAVGSNKTYFVYAVRNISDGSTKFVASLSSTVGGVNAANLTGWEIFSGSRVGCILTNGAAQITNFVQEGNRVGIAMANIAVSSTNINTSLLTVGIATVPVGIQVDALIQIAIDISNGVGAADVTAAAGPASCIVGGTQISSLTLAAGTRLASDGADRTIVGSLPIRTNTAAQIARACSVAGSNSVTFSCSGWVDFSCRRLFA
jgi:hypothetical protein